MVIISGVVMPLIIYSGLLLFLVTISTKTWYVCLTKIVLACTLYLFSLIVIWESYKEKEWHTNVHSGYPPVRLTEEAALSVTGFTLYNIVLLWFVWFAKRKVASKALSS